MPRSVVIRESPVRQSGRLLQAAAMFDLPPSEKSKVQWNFEIPIEERDWNVGLIVGPSGCGKTTAARELFPGAIIPDYSWPDDAAVLDGFPQGMGIKEIIDLISSVGFNSPPSWMRPFKVLSNGEQFRVTCARVLSENRELAVIDEFTSVVDRQVAKVISHCVQKAVRKRGQKFIALSCHYDVLDWLQPDWVYQPATAEFQWRELQRHPPLEVDIQQVDRSLWRVFRSHHYLSGEIHPGAKCFAAFLNGQPVAFSAVLHFPHARVTDIKMGHRLVVLPDYQGLGIGGRLDDWLGEYLYARGYRYRNVVAHPAMIAFYSKSPRWACKGKAGAQSLKTGQSAGTKQLAKKQMQVRRLNTWSFEYVPLPKQKTTPQ